MTVIADQVFARYQETFEGFKVLLPSEKKSDVLVNKFEEFDFSQYKPKSAAISSFTEIMLMENGSLMYRGLGLRSDSD